MPTSDKAEIEIVLKTASAERSLDSLMRDRVSGAAPVSGGGFGAGRALSRGRGAAGGGGAGMAGALGRGASRAGTMAGLGRAATFLTPIGAGPVGLAATAAATAVGIAGGGVIRDAGSIIGNKIQQLQNSVWRNYTNEEFRAAGASARAEMDARTRALDWASQTHAGGDLDRDQARAQYENEIELAEMREQAVRVMREVIGDTDEERNEESSDGTSPEEQTADNTSLMVEILRSAFGPAVYYGTK